MATSTTAEEADPEGMPGVGGCAPKDSDATERAIPIRRCDLTRLLLADPALTPVERAQLGKLANLIGAVFHYEYQAWLQELKTLYAPLDPDSDCVNLAAHSSRRSESADEAFLKPFEAALIRANYRPLKLEVIREAIAAPNEKGLTYVPDFSLFEHLKVYVRGNTQVSRFVRNFKTKFRKKTVTHPGYRRFVVALKFKPGRSLDDYVRDDVLYLRMFKDVPHVDMEMHLPEQGTRVKMRIIDKAQIASPIVVYPTSLAMKYLAMLAGVMSTMPSLTIPALMMAPISAGINSFFGFHRARQRHLHAMIRHLYYLSLAHNGSVITQLIDSAEDEEYKEALLAYFCLWRHGDDPDPWDSHRLDACIERLIKQHTGLDVDFEIGDALQKLSRLGLVQADPQGRLRAAPLDRALEILDSQWDDYFPYHVAGNCEPPAGA
jgi:hypothetical protein